MSLVFENNERNRQQKYMIVRITRDISEAKGGIKDVVSCLSYWDTMISKKSCGCQEENRRKL